MRVSQAEIGNTTWQDFQRVISAGRGEGFDRLPRGGAKLGGSPEPGEYSQLPAEWADDIAHASHVIYHYGTPVAWVDTRDGGWVVPNHTYSPQTSGCQNRIREAVGPHRTEPRG